MMDAKALTPEGGRWERRTQMPDLLTRRGAHCHRSLRIALLTCLTVLLLSVHSFASPRLSCEMMYGGETRILEFAPVSDPYGVKAVDIYGRFRFKAVMAGNEHKVDYIKLYTYDLSSGRAVLLHQASYESPIPQEKPSPYALTGRHFLYSPKLGREMQYGCTLIEASP